MSTEETRKLARNYLDVLNRALSTGNVDLLDDIATPDFIEHGNSPGRDSWKRGIAMSREILPDGQLTVEAILADGDTAAIRATLRGTHKSEWEGQAPTDKKVEIQIVDIIRFSEGKAVERWSLGDEAGMMRQLGMLPPEQPM